MNKNKKFSVFLKSLVTSDNISLVESINAGFNACFEGVSGKHQIIMTYEIVTPEDAEIGEPSERGYADERGNRYDSISDSEKDLISIDMELDRFDIEEEKTIVDTTVDYLNSEGAIHYSGSTWFSTEGEQDSDWETLSFHLENYSDNEIAEIASRIG